MPDVASFSDFHFLRPAWLLALLPAVLLWLVLRRRFSAERQWRKVIAPHLLSHLKVGEADRWRFRPLHLIVSVVMLGALAVAGPTWKREISPFAEDAAPLVIALDLSKSMNAIDVQPTRLERAKQKIRDLLAQRAGARTALIAYAGTAHTVLPLCDDPSVFETFVDTLSTELMPVAGKDPSLALALAQQLLATDEVPGSILFLTDGIGKPHVVDFEAHARQNDDEVLVLAVGTREGGPIRAGENRFETDAGGRRIVATLDIEGLDTLASAAGAFVAGVTVDDADVRRIQRRVQSHLRQVRQEDETARWKDAGYYLVFPVALLGLLWFRKGWTVRWSATALALVLFTGCSPVERGHFRFTDLWLTPDQRGWRHFDRGDYAAAAERFVDPLWKGVAYYRAENLEQAIDWLARVNTPEAAYNLGNAYARLEQYEDAVTSYEQALSVRPGWDEARENLDLVRTLIPAEAPDDEEPPPGGEPSFEADEVKFDERGEKGQRGEVDLAQLTDDQLAEMWMRRLQTTPADFLRQRFAAEAAEDAGRKE